MDNLTESMTHLLIHRLYKYYNAYGTRRSSIFCITCVICSFSSSHAHANFFERHAEGWHWYEPLRAGKVEEYSLRDRIIKTEDKPKPETPDKSKPQNDPVIQLEAFKKEVERLKAVAVLNPTTQNVMAYMVIQKELMDRSTRFAQKWMEVVYQTPSLDYTLHHPTSQAGRHTYLDQTREILEKKIRSLSQTHGLFFFYSGSCPYCKQFAPIVKSFAAKYHWEVLAISLDGNILPEFPDSRRNNGSASVLGVKVVPALLAVEPRSSKVIPLSHGISTHDQIEDRIRVLLMKGGHL
ncbi:MAG: type-F conjugative transfer system pilin assembly protein TraF [Bacillota bacterium]|nr:type-F conjugative transfer system pilin assembly protein TraF [Bacillota bacterium]